jgi:hypothetical protein
MRFISGAMSATFINSSQPMRSLSDAAQAVA